jgi:hypothetical protein
MSLAIEFLGVAKKCLTHTYRLHFDLVTLYYNELLDFAITSHTKPISNDCHFSILPHGR